MLTDSSHVYKVSAKILRNNYSAKTASRRKPSAWRLGFLAKKFLGFLTFLAKILAIILGKVRKILQYFSRSWKEIQENFGLLGKKTKTIQDLGKRTMKSLHQSNSRSIGII